MRNLPINLQKKLASHVQAGASALSPSVWVSRPNTHLVDDLFLEKQELSVGSNVTRASIAARHPALMKEATDIYIAYVDGGTAKVVNAVCCNRMSDHKWEDTGFAEPAEDISICFGGTMPKSTKGDVEFKTKGEPWVFWIHESALYGQQLGSEEKVKLAEANCVAVSAVRAMWSEVGNFDFGLAVFFIAGGHLYYRQYINGQWFDAEIVNAVPQDVLWSDVSAFRTWDYRIGVQLVAQDGSIYELFTQYMGIGKQSAEHIEIKRACESSKLTAIMYGKAKMAEHTTIEGAENVTPYQGIYVLGVPSLVRVYNVDDGTGNWGKQVIFEFDKELENASVQASINTGSFYFVDKAEKYYFPSAVKMDHTGRRACLAFVDINNAVGKCTAYYKPGTVVTMVKETLGAQQSVFVPQNLVPNDRAIPEVVEMWNTNDIGTEVAIRFTEPIVTVPASSAANFVVTIQEPEYSPGGPLSSSVKTVIDVSRLEDGDQNVIVLHFEDGVFTSIRNAVGDVVVQYMGAVIEGKEGPVLGFRKTFTPVGLAMKPNPHDPEHVQIVGAAASAYLTTVAYSVAKASNEHIQIVGASANAALTRIADL